MGRNSRGGDLMARAPRADDPRHFLIRQAAMRGWSGDRGEQARQCAFTLWGWDLTSAGALSQVAEARAAGSPSW